MPACRTAPRDTRAYRRHILWACLAACAGLPLATPAAESAFGDDARSAWRDDAAAMEPARHEVSTTVLPPGPDAPVSALQPGAQAAAGGVGAASTGGMQYVDVTRWFEPGARAGSFGLALGLGVPAPSAAASPAAAWAAPGTATGQVTVDLGVRWRSRLDSARQLDISAWARAPQWTQPQDAMGMIWQSQAPMFATRVEVQWASSRTRGLVPEFGAVGVQLQSGSRLVLRARKGGPMLYYRAKF